MDKELIAKKVKKLVDQALNGQIVENPKVDLKAKWYDLKSKPGINEFLKDTSSIANTFGPEGFLIIGVAEKTQSQENVSFKDCGLRDPNELIGLINKRVDEPYDLNYFEEEINGFKTGIIHIPSSLSKPHVIKNYQTFNKDDTFKREERNRIFVRSGESVRIANKNDLELMYYDRKNIHPDYVFDFFVTGIMFRQHSAPGSKPFLNCYLSIENMGKRTAAIYDIIISFSLKDQEMEFINPFIEMDLSLMRSSLKEEVKNKNIICKPNDISQYLLKFNFKEFLTEDLNLLNQTSRYIEKVEVAIVLNNGKMFKSQAKFSL